MDIFDEKIIGYDSIKNTLRQIADQLRRSDDYTDMGVELPHGLLLDGVPGIGKSTLALCLAEASGRYYLLLRKTKHGNAFLEELCEAFNEAERHAPSVIILEDIHLYCDSPHSAEWSTLQSNFDNCRNKDVFVVATTNETHFIANSLLRPGRFDHIISLPILREKDAENVIAYYLRDKNLSPDVILSDIVKVLDGYSCATLETVINFAYGNAVYEQSDCIKMPHIVKALMQVIYKASQSDKDYTRNEWRVLAIHEASHAVVSEILFPGSVSVVSILSADSDVAGFTDYYNQGYSTEEDLMNVVKVSLAGKAGVEVLLGKFGIGTDEDIRKAYKLLATWANDYAGGGFSSYLPGHCQTSDIGMYHHEMQITSKLEDIYGQAKKIVFEHRSIIEMVAEALLEKQVLLSSDLISICRK